MALRHGPIIGMARLAAKWIKRKSNYIVIYNLWCIELLENPKAS